MVKLPNPKVCTNCGAHGRITDSRPRASIGSHRRRYRCETCGNKWCTYETVLDPRRIRVSLHSSARHTVTKTR